MVQIDHILETLQDEISHYPGCKMHKHTFLVMCSVAYTTAQENLHDSAGRAEQRLQVYIAQVLGKMCRNCGRAGLYYDQRKVLICNFCDTEQ